MFENNQTWEIGQPKTPIDVFFNDTEANEVVQEVLPDKEVQLPFLTNFMGT